MTTYLSANLPVHQTFVDNLHDNYPLRTVNQKIRQSTTAKYASQINWLSTYRVISHQKVSATASTKTI